MSSDVLIGSMAKLTADVRKFFSTKGDLTVDRKSDECSLDGRVTYMSGAHSSQEDLQIPVSVEGCDCFVAVTVLRLGLLQQNIVEDPRYVDVN